MLSYVKLPHNAGLFYKEILHCGVAPEIFDMVMVRLGWGTEIFFSNRQIDMDLEAPW